MKKSVCRAAMLILAVILACQCLLPCAFAENAAAAPQASEAPTDKPKVSAEYLQNQGILTVGAQGDDVTKLQQRLKDLGYLNGKVDGKFGGGTKRAVIAFQRRNKLTADGEAGATTQQLLYSEGALAAPGNEKTDVLAPAVPMLINKETGRNVDEFFKPADLVKIKDVLGTKLAKIKYKDTMGVRTAVEALKAMLEAAKEDGIGKKWQIAAGYRTWDQQTKMLNSKISSYKKKNKDWSSSKARRAALRSVAEPGTSEHHLGLAFDVNKQGSSTFAGTKHSEWLNEHCWEYGFIIRYTKEKENITGFVAEPWHIRYVGVEHAMYMKEHDLCLEEYVKGIEDGTIVIPGVEAGTEASVPDDSEEESIPADPAETSPDAAEEVNLEDLTETDPEEEPAA